jgi:hypothetical protein
LGDDNSHGACDVMNPAFSAWQLQLRMFSMSENGAARIECFWLVFFWSFCCCRCKYVAGSLENSYSCTCSRVPHTSTCGTSSLGSNVFHKGVPNSTSLYSHMSCPNSSPSQLNRLAKGRSTSSFHMHFIF